MNWIKTEERFPKKGQWVLCIIYTDGKWWVPFVTQYHGDGYFRCIESEFDINDENATINDYSRLIKNWMPLPKNPL